MKASGKGGAAEMIDPSNLPNGLVGQPFTHRPLFHIGEHQLVRVELSQRMPVGSAWREGHSCVHERPVRLPTVMSSSEPQPVANHTTIACLASDPPRSPLTTAESVEVCPNRNDADIGVDER